VRDASVPFVPSIFSRHRLKPTIEGQKAHESFYINEAGFRGPSFSIPKPEGLTRIIIIGGSAVFDKPAEDKYKRDDWPHLAEQFLKKLGYGQVEVINAGIPAHASFDSLGRLYSQIWMYEPDFVLLYNAWNDIKYFRKLTPHAPLISLYGPYDDKRNPFMNYQGLWDRLFSFSQLYVKVRSRYYKWKKLFGKEGIIEAGEFQDTYSPYGPQQYRLNVELFVDACRNIGATPILLTQATLVTTDNSREERERIVYKYPKLSHSALVRAYEETYQIIQSVGKEKGALVLDLASQFNGQTDLFKDHVHTTKKGSEQIASAVARFLGKLLDKQVM